MLFSYKTFIANYSPNQKARWIAGFGSGYL